eukprot:TRINITY_DN92283_c0_g1_i1.p1 TRINITY_DN92283_c0_g1~~TRINITY_DN92283_c0_g1_i1.p1  ORF type:complete len:335 (+),score=91.84 TRINITY_DN92283_c0_g1_i1:64-1005(+)
MKRSKRGGKKALKAQEPSEESSDEEEDAIPESDGSDFDVDFDFMDPDENDYHGVSTLLKAGTWEFITDLNFTHLGDSLCGQGNIGTLVKSEADVDEATVCALLTALNMRQFQDKKLGNLSWPKQVSESLVEKAKKHAEGAAAGEFEAVLLGKKEGETGLLLSERLANLPGQLIPPLHKALVDDIEWSLTTPECPPEERPFYEFSRFVGVTKCFESVGGNSAASASAGAPKKKKARTAVAGPDGLSYPQPEMEMYVKHASLSFNFPMPTAKEGQEGRKAPKSRGKELRTVFLISRKGLDKAISEIQKMNASSST